MANPTSGIFLATVTATLLFLGSCSGGGGGEVVEIPIDSLLEPIQDFNPSENLIDDIVSNVSSPIELAALIERNGVPYDSKYLAPTTDLDQYNTDFKKAIALGVYGADLGYLNIYGKQGSVLEYISAIKKLSDDLRIGQFFEFEKLKDFALNSDNIDSLLYLSISSFNRMDKYLRETNRSETSTLIVAGTWLEALYIATRVAIEKHNPEIEERIGEQSVSLDELFIILERFESKPGFAPLIEDFKRLKDVYEPVEITYEIGEPEYIEENDMLIIKQVSKINVDMPEGHLNTIMNTVKEIRDKLILQSQ